MESKIESDDEASFNFNSESTDEEYTFPTAACLVLPEVKLKDPVIDIETSMKRVPKDFIGSSN